MTNPSIPVRAPAYSPPPLPSLPVVDQSGRYTPVGIEYQEKLWASIHGTGGLGEQIILEEGRSQSIILNLEDKVAALEALVAQLAQTQLASLQDRLGALEALNQAQADKAALESRVDALEALVRTQAAVIQECCDLYAVLPPHYSFGAEWGP